MVVPPKGWGARLLYTHGDLFLQLSCTPLPPVYLQRAAREGFPKSTCKLTRTWLSTVLRMTSEQVQGGLGLGGLVPSLSPAQRPQHPPAFCLLLAFSWNPRLLRDTFLSVPLCKLSVFFTALHPVSQLALQGLACCRPGHAGLGASEREGWKDRDHGGSQHWLRSQPALGSDLSSLRS